MKLQTDLIQAAQRAMLPVKPTIKVFVVDNQVDEEDVTAMSTILSVWNGIQPIKVLISVGQTLPKIPAGEIVLVNLLAGLQPVSFTAETLVQRLLAAGTLPRMIGSITPADDKAAEGYGITASFRKKGWLLRDRKRETVREFVRFVNGILFNRFVGGSFDAPDPD